MEIRDHDIEAGRILVVSDTDEAPRQVAHPAIEATGATRLPFDHAKIGGQ